MDEQNWKFKKFKNKVHKKCEIFPIFEICSVKSSSPLSGGGEFQSATKLNARFLWWRLLALKRDSKVQSLNFRLKGSESELLTRKFRVSKLRENKLKASSGLDSRLWNRFWIDSSKNTLASRLTGSYSQTDIRPNQTYCRPTGWLSEVSSKESESSECGWNHVCIELGCV